MGADNEVCKDTARAYGALLSASLCVGLKGSSRQPPYLLGQFPVNSNSRFFKGIDERFGATWRPDQLCEHGSSGDECTPMVRRI